MERLDCRTFFHWKFQELDDLRLSVDWKPVIQDHAVLLNRPYFSSHSCVSFNIQAAAVTSLLQRSRLLEAEGADDTVTFDSTVALQIDNMGGAR